MTLIEIIDAFTFYGLDVIALAVVTCLLVQLLKKTLFKNRCRKLLTFMPFLIGGLLYAAYFCLRSLSFKALFTRYVEVLEYGFSVGALSTVVYVWYEQFVRGKKTESAAVKVIESLIEGYVDEELSGEAAEKICRAIERDVTGNGAEKTADILIESCGGRLKENDARVLARLIIETLARINT